MASQINGITAQPNQTFTIPLPDGTSLAITMTYMDSNLGWYCSLNWNNGQWISNGRRIVTHPNMLRQYKNILKFGIACLTTNNREPTQIQDFASGASGLFLLSATEVQGVENLIQGLKSA